MEEELVTNTIKSVYRQKPELLSRFQRNKRKATTNYRPKTTNYLKEIQIINNISDEKSKSIKNEIKNISYEKYKNKNIYHLKTLNDENTHSITMKNIIKNQAHSSESKTLRFRSQKQDLIKKDKTVYLLRKIYIILPNDKMKMYNDFYHSKLQFDFYYPTEIKSKRIVDFIDSAKNDYIICNNLKDIFLEVYKYLKLSKDDFVKLEIYDQKFCPIKLESQLFVNKIRIIYVKITYISEEIINAWKNRLKSRMFFSNFIYLNKNTPELIKLNYINNDVSTEINNDESKNKTNIRSYKKKPLTMVVNKQNYNSNFLSQDVDVSTRYNTILQTIDRNQIGDDLKEGLRVEKKINLIIPNNKIIINKTEDNKSINPGKNPMSNQYLRTFSKTINLQGEKNKDRIIIPKEKKFEINKNRIKKNYVLDLIKNHEYEKNTLISPLLFDFDITDIINNKYVLKYLSIKSKDKKQKNRFQIKNKFEIKTLHVEDSNPKREIKRNTIIDIKAQLINKAKHYGHEISLFEKNKKLLIELNSKIKEFIECKIDNWITNEEIEDFKYLNCNYVLINKLKKFPLLKLKKQFIVFVYLSEKMISKYEKIYANIMTYEDFLNDILKIEELAKSLIYLNFIFNDIVMRKNFLLGYLSSININFKISFVFFLLFIFYNKNLIEKNPMNKLIYISFECAEISINSGISFQQYCDYYLLMTRNCFISYNKKFNFIKDLILRVFLTEKFNVKKTIKKLESIFENININKIKKILNTDMCSVKLKTNIDTYNNVEEMYNELINFLEQKENQIWI